MNLKTGLIILVVIGIFCCKVAEPLTLQRMDYSLNNLKTQGYFYSKGDHFHCFFLYKNGIVYFYSTSAANFLELENKISNQEIIKIDQKLQYVWGVFKINNDEIMIERWLPGVGGPYPTQLLKGQILNDTTIAISGLRGRKYASEIDTFKFRFLEQKPDSTNAFIE